MKEIKDIIAAFDAAQREGRQTALATVVHVQGSSYRRPGARMLVTDEGQLTGAISGGCLEGDALRKALYVMNRKQTMLVSYNTADDEDAALGVGLGCNGIVQVLIEPIDPRQENHPIALLKTAMAHRQGIVLATLFSLANRNGVQPGTCLLVRDDTVVATVGQDNFCHTVLMTDAIKALAAQTSSFKQYISGTQSITAFIEYLPPAVSLVIVGAGNDALPLVQMAGILGWSITVADGRTQYARPERFPPYCRVILSRAANLLGQLAPDAFTAVVLMTHNYAYDLAVLKTLLGKNIPYIGSLGPRKKTDRMLKELQAMGIFIDAVQQECIYGPSGLDIGAETPYEIALSIMAEIKAVMAHRQGQHLRNHTGAIHSGNDTFIEAVEIDAGHQPVPQPSP